MSYAGGIRSYIAPTAIVGACLIGMQLGLVDPETARADEAELKLQQLDGASPTGGRLTESGLADMVQQIERYTPWIEEASRPLPDAGALFARAGELATEHSARLRKFTPSDVQMIDAGVNSRDVQLELSGSIENVRDMLGAFERELEFATMVEMSVRSAPDGNLGVVARYRLFTFNADKIDRGETPG